MKVLSIVETINMYQENIIHFFKITKCHITKILQRGSAKV